MARFTIPRNVFFGPGCMKELKNLKGFTRAFIVTGGVVPELGLLKQLEDILHAGHMETCSFTEVENDPSVETVLKGAALMQLFQPNLIIAIGGGSAMDAAKGMWVFYEYPEKTFPDLLKPGGMPKLRTKARLACIPTTSGTGSEVTSFAVFTDHKAATKYPIADVELTPDYAVLDAEITATMPPSLVANTGMDALTHAVEAYVSTERSSFTNPLAIHSIAMILGYLKDSYDGDLKARGEMHLAQCMAGMAFSNAQLGINHSLAHKIGGVFGLPHGLCNAILMPYVIQYNAKNPAASRHYANIARRAGLDGLTEKILANSLIREIRDLSAYMNLPYCIKDTGLNQFKFDLHKLEIAEKALEDPCTQFNPRVPTVEDLVKVLDCAFHGKNVVF